MTKCLSFLKHAKFEDDFGRKRDIPWVGCIRILQQLGHFLCEIVKDDGILFITKSFTSGLKEA